MRDLQRLRSVELDLLVECCRSAFDEARSPEDPDGPDWERFLRLARRHRVQGLAHFGLGQARWQPPDFVAEQLAVGAFAIAEANFKAATECAALRQDFERAGIPLLFVKGLTLGALAYAPAMLKMSSDIDVLIRPADLLGATELLMSRGYRPIAGATVPAARHWKESSWYRDSDGRLVDLHTRLADSPRIIADIGMQSPTQAVQVAPGITLPTLCSEQLIIYLCVHGASSAWFRLKWISDLAALLNRCGASDVAALVEEGAKRGAAKAIAQALLLASRLFALAPLEPLAQRLRRRPINRLLEAIAVRQLTGRRSEREPTERAFGTAGIHLSQLLIMPDSLTGIGEIGRQLRTVGSSRKARVSGAMHTGGAS